MTRDRFNLLRALFEKLQSAGKADREDQLGKLDPELARELRAMLDAHDDGTGALDLPAVQQLFGAPKRAGLAEGDEVGPYRIRREVGRGGMGIVYEASRADGNFERRVAIKILRHDRIDDLFAQRFQQERRILAQLNHPHIASILDAGTTAGGEPYFVMEYVEGIPITRYCAEHGLSVTQKLDLFLQVSDAVEHAHRNLTVHRDLKPANILVTSAGAAKLLDFGIAKLLPPEPPDGTEPPTAVVLTPEYASPEQVKKEPITTSADVFALGILLYELLTGRHPFRQEGALAHDVMRALASDDAPPGPRLGSELDAIVMTALRKSPEWRYQSVAHLSADIVRYRHGWPVQARGDSLAYRFGKFARRHWMPLVAGVAAVAVLLASLVVAESERRREQERYRQLRALTASLLFDLHDGIRDLAGSSTARKLIVAKAKQELDALSSESKGDIEWERDLAAAYERMGELRVDAAHPDKAGTAAALESYTRAVAMRRAIAGRAGDAGDRRYLALSLTKLGDGQVLGGDLKNAAISYREAWNLARSLVAARPEDGLALRALGTVDRSRCLGLVTAGDTAGALDACKEGIETLRPMAGKADDLELQRVLATTEASYANALRLARRAPEAAEEARLALDSLQRLVTLAPSNAEYRRLSSSAGTVLAISLAATGDNAGSTEAFREAVRSMEVAVEIDPADLGSPLRLAVTLLAFSRRLAATGDRAGAHQSAQEGLQLLERAAGKPGAGAVEWNEYADALLKVDADLANPRKALELSERAVTATKRTNPFFLDTLAWAYYRTGDAANAAATERSALQLLPSDAKGGLHEELERGLTTFTGTSAHRQ